MNQGKLIITVMDNSLIFSGEEYISASRAAKLCGYANDYIGQLCRGGKVESKRIGRLWYVSKNSLFEHKKSNSGVGSRRPKYVAGQSLEIKTKTIAPEPKIELKVGEKILDVKSYEINNGSSESKKLSDENKTYQTKLVSLKPRIVSAGEKQLEKCSLVSFEAESIPSPFFSAAISNLSSALAICLLLIGLFSVNWSNLRSTLILTFDTTVNVAQSVQAQVSGSNLFSRVALNTYYYINSMIIKGENIYRDFAMSRNHKQIVVNQNTVPQTTENKPVSKGMVVVPSEDNESDIATIAAIKNSFSDEVVVKPDEAGDTGVITPVFKQRSGDDYIYVLVPIKN